MKIIVVDDNTSFRKGLITYLVDILNHTVIGEAENAEEFLSLPNIKDANIVLMDNCMPQLKGIEVSKQYLLRNPKLKIIMLTLQPELLTLKELVESGLCGCVDKKDIHFQLPKALNRVQKGDVFFPENLTIL